MKKITSFTVILVFLFAIKAYNQTEKGTLILGSLNFNSANYEEDVPISFNPHIGYFVSDNLALGLNFAFLWEFGDGDIDIQNAIGPYLKVYLGEGNRGRFYSEFKPILALKNNYFEDMIYGFTVNAGYAYFITDKLSMEYSAQLSKVRSSDFIVSLNVGVNIHLGKSE